MEDNIKEKIIRIVGIVIIIILGLLTINSNSKYNTLKDDIDTYKIKISKLEDKKEEYESLIESYKKSQLEDKETIKNQQENIEKLENEIEKKNNNIATLNKTIKELEKQANQLNEEIIKLQKNIKDQGNMIMNLNGEILEHKTTIVDLTSKIDEHKTTITNLTNNLNTEKNKVSSLTTTNEILNSNIKDLEDELKIINTYKLVNNELELLEAFKTSGNILLNADIIMSADVIINNKNLSIDLRGHNLLSTAIDLTNTSLEIKDSSPTNSGKFNIVGDNDTSLRGIRVKENSTLKITNGNYEGKNLIQILDQGNVFIIGGNFQNTQEELINASETSKLELYGGTFSE